MIRMPSKNLGLFFACVLFYSEYIYIHLFRLMGDPTVRMNNVSKLITFFNNLRKYWHLAGPFCRAKAIKACIETLYSSSFHAVPVSDIFIDRILSWGWSWIRCQSSIRIRKPFDFDKSKNLDIQYWNPLPTLKFCRNFVETLCLKLSTII